MTAPASRELSPLTEASRASSPPRQAGTDLLPLGQSGQTGKPNTLTRITWLTFHTTGQLEQNAPGDLEDTEIHPRPPSTSGTATYGPEALDNQVGKVAATVQAIDDILPAGEFI